jgi:hypothetical protein
MSIPQRRHTPNTVTTSGLGTLQISTENVGADAPLPSTAAPNHGGAFSAARSPARIILSGAGDWIGGGTNGYRIDHVN